MQKVRDTETGREGGREIEKQRKSKRQTARQTGRDRQTVGGCRACPGQDFLGYEMAGTQGLGHRAPGDKGEHRGPRSAGAFPTAGDSAQDWWLGHAGNRGQRGELLLVKLRARAGLSPSALPDASSRPALCCPFPSLLLSASFSALSFLPRRLSLLTFHSFIHSLTHSFYNYLLRTCHVLRLSLDAGRKSVRST